jgi:hypothetical protein
MSTTKTPVKKNILMKGLVKKLVLTETEKAEIDQHVQTKDEKEAVRVTSVIEKAGKSTVGDILAKLKPVIDLANTVVDTLGPIIEKSMDAAYKTYKLLPLQLVYALIGLVIAFFGGTFAVTISAAEAFYASGYQVLVKNGTYLYKEFQILWKKSREDDMKDENNDGIADVEQITVKELITRKIGFFFAHCSDPQKLMDMIYGIGNSILAVIAVLKVQFAKVIALGLSIGENMRKPATYIFAPIFATILPTKYHQWIAPGINLVCKSVALTIAWTIQKVISAVQSGVRGGLMFSRRLLAYCNEKGWTDLKDEDTYLDEIVGWGVAFLGVYFQITFFFSLPFPLNILMSPVSLLESTLIWVISE